MKNNDLETQKMVRVLILVFLVMAFLTVILTRLWSIQVLSNREYARKAQRQFVRNIRVPAARGRIFSSDRMLLAGNKVSYDVQFHLSEMLIPGKRKKVIGHILQQEKRVAEILGRKSCLTEEVLLKQMRFYPGIPMTVFPALTNVEMSRVLELTPPIQGLEVAPSSVRIYPGHSLASHLIGFVGKGDPGKADDRSDFFYYLPDAKGLSGLEQLYDKELNGTPGKKLVIVNNRGFVHKVVGEPVSAKYGLDLLLTIDSRLQRTAERLLRGESGAIVLLDATDGAVLAMASSPGYDLNLFIPRITSAQYKAFLSDPGKPFVNKATQGSFMPGSIVKPLMGLCMLENGISADSIVDCDGETMVGDASIRCWHWRAGGHGPLSLHGGIENSCNDFFIENGLKLGVDAISKTYASAGIGQKTGFVLPERAGLLPNRKTFRHWGAYDTALISIGQGRVEMTPLQAACYCAALANGGTLLSPLLVRGFYDNGKPVQSFRGKVRGHLAASSSSLEIVREGMYLAVNSAVGGAKRARVPGLKIYGKTGTAEVGSPDHHYNNTWFIGFTSTEAGKNYAIAVLVTHGRSGGATSAPLAAAMFEKLKELSL